MGNPASKFRRALQRGEEEEAIGIYLRNTELKRNLDPSASYGLNYAENTPLHYSCIFAMKSLMQDFLSDGGNPNKPNSDGRTALHCLCIVEGSINNAVRRHRFESLKILNAWRGKKIDGEFEKLQLDVLDKDKNSPLHYAAMYGLSEIVEYLVSNGAELYTENNSGHTACDCAEKKNFTKIASFLESKMVFANATIDGLEEESSYTHEEQQLYSGLCAQDLQEAKDQLIVETADMLRVPLFTAEALLRNHGWLRESLLEAWMENSALACEKSGVKPPPEQQNAWDNSFEENDSNTSAYSATSVTCGICGEDVLDVKPNVAAVPCGHKFCCECWKSYLHVKIQEGDAHNIQCPNYDCTTLVPVELIEKLVSRNMAFRYLHFDIMAFVESHPSLKWCPSPGCSRAVKLPPKTSLSSTRPSSSTTPTETASVTVDCGNGHFFCWHCSREPHEPSTCEGWTQWLEKIEEMLPKLPKPDISECPETEQVASTLWLVTNSKPCPNCKSPIQKNEGCNHMKCSKCKHEFCWVCQEVWKKHSSATGGYFKCNRYEAARDVDDVASKNMSEAAIEHKKVEEINHFLHYYTRCKNHENSFKLEEPLLDNAKHKMMALTKTVTETDVKSPVDTQFVENALKELLKARRVLKCSYGYGFYLSNEKEKKSIFELMQTELEEGTELLSQMVARPYLRTPRSKIIETTQILCRKRHEFLLALSRGLIPPEVESSVKRIWLPRSRRTDSDEEDSDEDFMMSNDYSQALCATLQEHIRQLRLQKRKHRSTAPRQSMGSCVRDCCSNPTMFNPFTREYQRYCSTRCYAEEKLQERKFSNGSESQSPVDADMLHAIQMSLLDQHTPSNPGLSSNHGDSSSEESWESASPADLALQSDLQRAIELSCKDLHAEVNKEPSKNTDRDLRQALALSLAESDQATCSSNSNQTISSNSNSLSLTNNSSSELCEQPVRPPSISTSDKNIPNCTETQISGEDLGALNPAPSEQSSSSTQRIETLID